MSKRKKLTDALRRFGRALPLLGPLGECTRKNHQDAFKEFAVTVLFGTATFWVTALFMRVVATNQKQGYLDLLYKTVESGQLFIFAVGMLGPILLAAADDPAKNKKFPGRISHMTFLVVIGVLAAGFYAIQLIARDLPSIGVDTKFLFFMSVSISVAILVLRYLTMVYRKSTVEFDPEEELKEPVKAFAEKFARMHEGEGT